MNCWSTALLVLLTSLMRRPAGVGGFRKKMIKEFTRDAPYDFIFREIFPATWYDPIIQECQHQFRHEVFQCQNNIMLNALDPAKEHQLTTTAEGGFIYALTAFYFVYQIKNVCYDKDFELNCGCMTCEEYYPKRVCEVLLQRDSWDSFGGCDPKSRWAMNIFEIFTENFLNSLPGNDSEVRTLIARNMEVGKKEAMRLIRTLSKIYSGDFCGCASHFNCSTREHCYEIYIKKVLRDKVHQNALFENYKRGIKVDYVNNTFVNVLVPETKVNYNTIIYTSDYEPNCEKEVRGRVCINSLATGSEYISQTTSSDFTQEGSIFCDELCTPCSHMNYTVQSGIENYPCRCKMELYNGMPVVGCEECNRIYYKCE